MKFFVVFVRIYCVTPTAFFILGLDNLDHLVMNNNELTHLGENYFSGVPMLTTLYIDHNRIQTINNKAFTGLEGKEYYKSIIFII